jgi:Uma2 family endonuclease
MLQNGDRLRSKEFLRRYEAMPEIKKAELIEGMVYMGSPISAKEHSEPDGLIHTWLGTYAAHTPGVRFFPNTTVILDTDNTPQPDACLCLSPERGGRTVIAKYLTGAPELIVEIAASSVSLDLNDKMDAYARNGVNEYLVWRTLEHRFDWFVLENENYAPVRADRHGLLRGAAFPGLVLDGSALLALNSRRVLAVLQRGLASAAHKAFAAKLA